MKAGEDVPNEVRELIGQFAARLLELNGGRTIPRRWKNALLRALQPKRRKPGRKADVDRLRDLVGAIVSDAALGPKAAGPAAREKRSEGTRTPAKQRIAQRLKTSTRAVERVQKTVEQHIWSLSKLPDDKKRVVVEGISAELQRRLALADAQEFAERQRRASKGRKGGC